MAKPTRRQYKSIARDLRKIADAIENNPTTDVLDLVITKINPPVPVSMEKPGGRTKWVLSKTLYTTMTLIFTYDPTSETKADEEAEIDDKIANVLSST